MEHSFRNLVVVAALFLLAIGPANAQTEGPGRELVPSNVGRLAADTLRSGNVAVSKVFTVPYAGKIRATWQFRSNEAGKTGTVTVTSLADGCSGAASSSQTFIAQTCDLRVVAGDEVMVTASGQVDFSNPGFNSNVSLRNVRLRWNVVDSAGTGTVLAD